MSSLTPLSRPLPVAPLNVDSCASTGFDFTFHCGRVSPWTRASSTGTASWIVEKSVREKAIQTRLCGDNHVLLQTQQVQLHGELRVTLLDSLHKGGFDFRRRFGLCFGGSSSEAARALANCHRLTVVRIRRPLAAPKERPPEFWQ